MTKLENKIIIFYQSRRKDSILTEEDEEDFKNSKFCRFNEETKNSKKNVEVSVT